MQHYQNNDLCMIGNANVDIVIYCLYVTTILRDYKSNAPLLALVNFNSNMET